MTIFKDSPFFEGTLRGRFREKHRFGSCQNQNCLQNTSFKNTVLHFHFAWKEKLFIRNFRMHLVFHTLLAQQKGRLKTSLVRTSSCQPSALARSAVSSGWTPCLPRSAAVVPGRSGVAWAKSDERKLMDTARPFFPRWAQDTARKKSSSGNSMEDSLVKVRCGAT